MFGGCSWSKREMGCLFSGSRYFSERLSATVKMDFFLNPLCRMWFFDKFSIWMVFVLPYYLSSASITAASLLRCIGSMLVWISHAAVGVDLSAPEMKRRAWF